MGPCCRWLLAVWCIQVCSSGTARVSAFSTAYVNVSFVPPERNQTLWWREEIGLYGIESPTYPVTGTVYLADPIHACANDTRFGRPDGSATWIALVQRGNGCTFTYKINAAARSGASAAVIFNDDGTDNRVIQMSHPGTSIVAVMIGNTRGMALVELLQKDVSISMTIEVGVQHGLWMSHYSLLFISISFFIITTATVCYFIFYFAQRLNNIRRRNHKQKEMKAKAKKAIGQLKVRTLSQGDQETGPDADSCAVCIESYKPGDVLCVLTCNHFFHKACVEPWLMEHRTCPMCKCDILKAFGVETDVEEQHMPTVSSDLHSFPSSTEYLDTHSESVSNISPNSESHSDTASSGYESLHATEHLGPAEHTCEGLEAVCVEMQPHYDNPAFENETCS
ncbi:E3 ubiquitin-protein ligase RNF128a isoform X2 [Neoarius graeffei]|uniref:E3 ubiquitin-protein ligase RNF128a isoform X2 n=1 Tax=Neoarius graeffei TaxID=443677 RepID=UPI00298CF026|nr:E3 ubiquitin-protein ligase RNF128a isoform X2 [Neoarius graeffei]